MHSSEGSLDGQEDRVRRTRNAQEQTGTILKHQEQRLKPCNKAELFTHTLYQKNEIYFCLIHTGR